MTNPFKPVIMNPNIVYKAIVQDNMWGKDKTAYWVDAGKTSLKIKVTENGIEVEVYDNPRNFSMKPPTLKVNFSDFDVKFIPRRAWQIS